MVQKIICVLPDIESEERKAAARKRGVLIGARDDRKPARTGGQKSICLLYTSIPTMSNRVDIGVRVELPYEIFAHLTDELYESKIVYRTEKFQDLVRTFLSLIHI